MEVSQPMQGGTVVNERPGRVRARTHVPDNEIAELRDVEFPMAMRGYDRNAVDAYVSRVNRLLAELQITAAPEAAIRHALDEVTEETRGILEQAHQTAGEITQRSRLQADDRVQRAEIEAADIRAAAETYAKEVRDSISGQLRSVELDSARIWKQRAEIIAELRELAQRLEGAASAAEERLGGGQPPLRVPETPPQAPRRISPPAASVDEPDDPLLDDEL